MSFLPTGTTGALNELLVCTDLLERGYHVFRSVSPSCPCDLVAYRPGQIPRRIEVKTLNGTVKGVNVDSEKADVLATVQGKRVRYYQVSSREELIDP